MLYDVALKNFQAALAAASGRPELKEAYDELYSLGNTLYAASVFHFTSPAQDVLGGNPAFTGKESLLGPEFRLPDQFSYIEDPASGVALVDRTASEKGTDAHRLFIFVEELSASRLMATLDRKAVLKELFEAPDMFDGRLCITSGTIANMEPMGVHDPVDQRFNVAMSVRHLVVFEADGRVMFYANPFEPDPGRRGLTLAGFPESNVPMFMAKLGGNIRTAMRELAFYQATRDSDPPLGSTPLVSLIKPGC